MFFLDIGYSHVSVTYKGLELKFLELQAVVKSIFVDLRRDESLPVEKSSYRALVLWQSALKISTREHQGSKQGACLSKMSQKLQARKSFRWQTALETGINFQKRSLLFFTLFSHVRVLLLSNFAYNFAGINYNIFVHQQADCSFLLLEINCSHSPGVNKLTSRNVARI